MLGTFITGQVDVENTVLKIAAAIFCLAIIIPIAFAKYYKYKKNKWVEDHYVRKPEEDSGETEGYYFGEETKDFHSEDVMDGSESTDVLEGMDPAEYEDIFKEENPEDFLFTTKRLAVRRFQPEDGRDLAEILTDPEVTYFEPYPTFEEGAAFAEAEKLAKSEEFYAVMMESKLVGKIYFTKKNFDQPVDLWSMTDASNEKDELYSDATYEIGWTFNKDYQGIGYATESMKGMMNYAFQKLGAEKIFAEIDIRNEKSKALAERLGMHEVEGKREYFPSKEDEFKNNEFCFYLITKAVFYS